MFSYLKVFRKLRTSRLTWLLRFALRCNAAPACHFYYFISDAYTPKFPRNLGVFSREIMSDAWVQHNLKFWRPYFAWAERVACWRGLNVRCTPRRGGLGEEFCEGLGATGCSGAEAALGEVYAPLGTEGSVRTERIESTWALRAYAGAAEGAQSHERTSGHKASDLEEVRRQ